MSETKTAEKLIEQWDAGETVSSLDMSGMGPGYEQAIQITAIEFARAGTRAGMRLTGNSETDQAAFTKLCEEALSQFNDKLGGITGAMYGSAKWLAWQWCFNGGPDALVSRAREQGKADRCIQVSKMWPKI